MLCNCRCCSRYARTGILHRTPVAPLRWNPELPAKLKEVIGKASEKDRSRPAGGLRRKLSLRLLFLSAGEIGLADHLGIGRKTRAGQKVRLISIPADAGAGYGCFENLHEFHSPDASAPDEYVLTPRASYISACQ